MHQILILSLAVCLAYGNAEQEYSPRLLLKGYNVFPRTVTQAEVLKDFRDSDSNIDAYFSGGPIRVNHKTEVWVPNSLNNDFVSVMREANMTYNLEFRKIKFTKYRAVGANGGWNGGNLIQNTAQIPDHPVVVNQDFDLMDRYPDGHCQTDKDCDLDKWCAFPHTARPKANISRRVVSHGHYNRVPRST